jgi:hypothetical protein
VGVHVNEPTPLLKRSSDAVPNAVPDPLSKKLTVPMAVAGTTVAVSVTLCPSTTLVGAASNVVELAARPAAQAMARLFKSTDPSPVTRLYPDVVSAEEASKPINPLAGHR